MKKINRLFFCLLFVFVISDAYSQIIKKGDMIVSAGYGWPNIGKYLLNAINDGTSDNYKVTGIGPIHARFEYVLTKKWGIGASINYATFGANWTESSGLSTGISTYKSELMASSFNVLLRINRHYDVDENVDVYWGTGIGYNNTAVTFKSDDPNAVKETISSILPIGFESVFGIRYFFSEVFGAYIELGWSKSIMQGGLAFKF